MRLLDRYLLRELLIPLGFCLSGFLIFWISFDLFSQLGELQEHKLRAGDIIEYYFVKTPEFLVVVLPIALLLALLYALTNHARHHELTAIRAAGISLWRLSAPYLAVGFIASLVLLALNELAVPNSVEAAEQIMNRRLEKKKNASARNQLRNLGFTNSRDRRTWQIGAYNLKTMEMIDPKVDWQLPDGSHRELIARRAIRTNEVWVFYDVIEHMYAPVTSALTNRNPVDVLAMPEFSETPEQIKSEIKISNQSSKSRLKKTEIPLADIFDYLRLHPHLPPAERHWVFTQLHGRLAAPWTCLIVVLIAIPFGAASGRRNVFVGVASSIFICFVYFILLQLGLALGAGGYVPAWIGAWFPNLSFAAVGVWLTAKVR